jgi:hypothetical protein
VLLDDHQNLLNTDANILSLGGETGAAGAAEAALVGDVLVEGAEIGVVHALEDVDGLPALLSHGEVVPLFFHAALEALQLSRDEWAVAAEVADLAGFSSTDLFSLRRWRKR